LKILTTVKIIFAMFLWAICYPLITIGIAYAPHLTFATMRGGMAGIFLLGLAMALGRPLPRGGTTWATLAIIGFGATSLGYFGMFHAAEFVSPGIATVIGNTQPLLAAGLAGVVLGERLTGWGKTGLILGFMGIVVIAAPRLFAGGQESYLTGIAYIVLAALGITVSNVMLKRIADTVDPLMAIGVQLLIGSIPLAVIAAMTEDVTLIQWSPGFVFALVGLAVFGSALVYFIWMSVLVEVPLSKANAFSFLVPVFGLTMGLLYYGESLGWPELIGSSLALFGVIIVTQKGIAQPACFDVAA
tara:strand:+ start:534 stop:1436 length:903 start_codon:yes stop_codon:yes gene_type:complete